MLTDGGLPWYLGGFELVGTSAVEEQWTTGREALRSLSEELTDMDDDALKDLEFDVDEDNTITASPVEVAGSAGEVNGNGKGGGGETPRRRGRADVAAGPAGRLVRRGLRTSARRK